MTLIDRGAAMVARKLSKHASRSIRYESGGRTITVAATVGSTPTESTDPDGVVTRSSIRDYLIDHAQFAALGVDFEPKRGDVLVDGRRTFEAQPFADEPAARWSDRNYTRWRIHTRQISGPSL